MSTHETNLNDSLDVFDEDASEGVLKTWIDRDCCDRIVHACENMPRPPAPGPRRSGSRTSFTW